MGLEWGHGVGDINLGWKSAIAGSVHISQGLLGQLAGAADSYGDLYSCIFPFCCSRSFRGCETLVSRAKYAFLFQISIHVSVH